jgi:hypothetical protein
MVASGLHPGDLHEKPTITVNMCYVSPATPKAIRNANGGQVTELYLLGGI